MESPTSRESARAPMPRNALGLDSRCRATRSRSPRWVVLRILVPVLFLGTNAIAVSAPPSTSGYETSLAKLQDALQTIAAYRLRFWQTGDQQSLLPQLHLARDQANDAYRAFLAQRDAAHSAQSLIAVADIDRILTAANPSNMQEQQQSAARMYENALQLANQAKDPALEYKAMTGLIRTDLNSKNYDAASKHLNVLLAVAPKTGSPDDLLNAYDVASQVDLELGDLPAANDQLDRAVAMGAQVKDPSNLYYVYSDRADVYYSRFQQCNQDLDFELCAKAAELGFKDSRHAIDIATRAGYASLAAAARSRLADMKTLRGAQAATGQTQQKLLALKFRITKASQVVIDPHFTQPENPELAAALRAYENRVGLAGKANIYDPNNYDIEGRLDELEGHNDAALQNYQRAVYYLEQDRRKLGGSRANGDPLGDRIEIYYDTARQFLERREYSQAFEMLELSRSRSMAEMLESRKLSLRVPQDQALYSQAVALNSMVAGKQSELFNLAGSEQSSDHAKELRKAIDDLQARKRALNDRIARQSPKLLDLVDHTQVASLASLQASARRGNYDVLYYLSLASYIIIWHIDAESVQVSNVFYSGALLADRTQSLYD